MESILLIAKLLGQLARRRRRQLCIAGLLMILSGVAEAFTLAAVLPFLWVLTSPEELWQSQLVQAVAPLLRITSPDQFLLPAAVLFGSAVLISGAIRLLNLWVNAYLAAAIGFDFSMDAFRRSLYQPYGVHLSRNSSVLITALTSQLELAVLAVGQFLQLVSAIFIVIGVLVVLLLVDWKVALMAGTVAALIYGAFLSAAKSVLLRNSEFIAASSVDQVKILRESFGAIRDVLLNGTQGHFQETYRRIDWPRRQRQAQNQFLSLFPRYAVESVGMVAIVILAYLFVATGEGANEVIPILGTLALAAQRLLPTFQLIYSSWTDIRAKSHAVVAVLNVLSQDSPAALSQASADPTTAHRYVEFDHVEFSYSPEQHSVLRELSFRIQSGERIGIVGATGSGKSTLLDLYMGLLVPTTGVIRVDGSDLHDRDQPERLRAWRAKLASVPQNVYLTDSDFASNIAFGVPPEQVDRERVRQAAEQAQIGTFIESCSGGYDANVGERGIRLSGGQRQRIGIARALYRRASVLVFDEATNALDSSTEKAVMEAIDCLSRDLTIVIIAHRIETVARCDRIFYLKEGTISAVGSFEQMFPSPRTHDRDPGS